MPKNIDILKEFSAFLPNVAGDIEDRVDIALDNIKNIFPTLFRLTKHMEFNKTKFINIEEFSKNGDQSQYQELKNLLDLYGSDKANKHNYHHFYGNILKPKFKIKKILEIGMGTNNTDVLSNMGKKGNPGASLKAFRDFCPNANIYGADIDKRILFEEERIKTFYTDQTDIDSLKELAKKTPDNIDLIIDDGLHSLCANINTLIFGIDKIRIGGWVVIEDIQIASKNVWAIVSNLISDRFSTFLIICNKKLIFALKRVS